MSSDEEICSDYEVCTDDEGTGSSQELPNNEENYSDQGLSNESEIENDESGVDDDNKELIIRSRYVYYFANAVTPAWLRFKKKCMCIVYKSIKYVK